MKTKFCFSILLGLALSAFVCAQDQNDQNSAPAQNPNATAGQSSGGSGMGMGRRGGMGMMGPGIAGTVTEAASDHFTVKTFEGEVYTVKFGENTRFMKMQPGMGRQRGMRGGGGMGGNPPEQIKADQIKADDSISARGKIDSSSKTVDARRIMLLDPRMAERMRQMAADYGKTWLMGRVTAIEGNKVTLMGSQDQTPHTFVVNENTEFLERRNPITLADVKTGDMIRVQGSVSDGTFTASSVHVMSMPQRMGNGPGGPGAGSGANPQQL